MIERSTRSCAQPPDAARDRPRADPEELAEKSRAFGKGAQGFKIAKSRSRSKRRSGDEEDSHLGDFIEDKNAILPIDAAIQRNLRETTTRVARLAHAARGARAAHAFGIGMEHRHTLEEVGQQFSVTREASPESRRRRCENSKHPSRSRK